MEAQSAEWWEMQAGRYKEETAEIGRQYDALKAARNEEAENVKTALHTLQREHQAQVEAQQQSLAELQQQIESLQEQLQRVHALAEQRRTALADVLRAVAVVVEKVSPLLTE